MKRTVLLGRLQRMAAAMDVQFALRRHGGRQDVVRFGSLTVVVPRHREVDEMTARGILRDCEQRGEGRP